VVGDISIDSGAILASGQNHSCAIRPNGTVACWGENSSGQATPPSGTFISLSSGAGIGPDYTCGIRTDHSVACWGRASSPPAEKFAALSGSLRSVCGILTNGAVRCWGDNLYGQTDPPEGPFLAVAGGEDHACGIRSDHTIACWGRNHHGQATPPPGNFTAISAGGDTTCAVRTDGTMSCWGVLGVHPEGTFKAVSVRDESQICGIRTDGSAACWGSLAVPANAGAFSAIALGRGHACGMRTDGKVVCWGDNDYGQATPPGDQYVSVAIGTASCGMGSYLCGIRTDGTIACWGSSPANPPEGSFRVLSAGHGHVCAIRTDQTLVCWPGAGAVPQGRYRAVSVGFAHACALTVEGKPVCWGDSRGTTPDETFTSIAAGYQHTCAMRSDGSVVCWGTIEDIGCPPATPVTSSARSPDGAFTALAIGSHSCGIRPDGAVECWDHGCDEVLFSLRNGCPRRCSRGGGADVPAPSGPLSSVTSNMGSFCGLRPNGAAVCWGYQAVPASSMPQDSFAAIAVGTNWGPFACGIRASDSQLSCWGYIAR
jgi:alpha-tubulin suppressor-like RCC1 family protein